MVGNGHEVDVVGHQAITEDPDAGVRQVEAEQVEVYQPILTRVKGGPAIGTALSDVIGEAGLDAACIARHEIR